MGEPWVGRPLRRKEDARFLKGQGQFVADVRLPGTLHLAFLRSREAHARITHLDVAQAVSAPGVRLVLTGPDLASSLPPLPVAPAVEGMVVPPQPVLALDRVAYAGQAVAAVVAASPATAQEALQRIEWATEPLEPVVDHVRAAEGGPLVHPDLASNVAYTWQIAGGDVDAAFAQADRVVEGTLRFQRVVPTPMETRGALAQFDSGTGRLTFWASLQRPHLTRSLLSAVLQIPENLVRVIAPDVGGGFGCKVNFYAEDALVGYLARRLDSPVRWIEGRRESFGSTSHGRGQVSYAQFAVKNDGTLLGVRCRSLADVGAYHQFLSAAIPPLSGMMMSGCYRVPAIAATVTGVFTNKTPTDAYRGAGKPEAAYVVERMMDKVARALELDPVEVRRRNFIPPDAFPYQTPTHLVYDSGNYAQCLDRALEMIDYEGFRRRQREARARGELLGVGLCSYVELAAVGPSFIVPGGGWEKATVRVERSGRVTVLTGINPHGQGQGTVFAQIVADRLGVHPDDVSVRYGDTDLVSQGTGTWGSRGTTLGGSALVMALDKIVGKMTEIASFQLGGQARFESGRFQAEQGEKTLSEVIGSAYDARGLPEGMEPGLEASAYFDPRNFTFSFGTHAATVEVDPETGAWKVLSFVAVDDCGKVMNPLLVEGQLHGGVVQGLGQVLCEEAVYDATGRLVNGELGAYRLPRADDVPPMETALFETPSPFNPLGSKGVGESATIGSTPALVNALVDALAHLGVEELDMPVRPESLWRLLREAAR